MCYYFSNESSKRENISYFGNLKSLPIVPENLCGSNDNDVILPLLLNANQLHKELIGTTVPTNINKNARFLINLDELQDPEDLLSDSLGSWRQTKTTRKWYYINKNEDDIVTKIRKMPDKTSGAYVVCRRPFINASDDTLRKTIVDVQLPDGKNHNIVFIKYEFVDALEHSILVKEHGNSKSCSVPYLRTYKSTREQLKNVLKTGTGIKRSVSIVEEEMGDLEGCSSVSALPRNERQARYEREKSVNKNKDAIFTITERMKTEEDKFIRSYSLDDESPKVVLFSDEQVEDIVNFCCNDISGHNSIFYADVTFELGPFFLLMTTYKNTTVVSKRSGLCPLMVGPVMLCMLKDKPTYLTLFQKLTTQVPGLIEHLKAYSSDGEKSLRQALAQCFPEASAFLCSVHAAANVEEKLSKLRISSTVAASIIDDIFGAAGLVHERTQADFNLKLKHLVKKWDQAESRDTKRSPQFSKYFVSYKADDIWKHVSAKASLDAGFGNVVQTNNIPESANALLKRWQNFQATDMASFIDDLKALVKKQRRDVQRAFLGMSSPYNVRPEYIRHVRNGLGSSNPGELLNTQLKVHVDPRRYKQVKDYRPTPKVTAPSHRDADSELCIMYELTERFSPDDIKSLLEKVKILINDGVRKGFDESTFIVKSSSQPTPHIVKALSKSGYACDKNCMGYKSRKICAHTIAASFFNKDIQGHINWYKKQRHTENLTALTTFSVNATAGRKTQARKSRRGKSPDPMREAQPLTLADIVANEEEDSRQVTYTSEIRSNPLRLTIRKDNQGTKPPYTPTTSTPFELIDLSNRVTKCAGCRGLLRSGPDQFTKNNVDSTYCIRHKEHDHIWVESHQSWRKTFDNKHYHVFTACIVARNPGFNPEAMAIRLQHTMGRLDLECVKTRLGI